MKARISVAFGLVAAGIVIASGAGIAAQWREAALLRTELELAKLEAGELAQLRQENQRLRAAQTSAAEVERLRADHAALPRLRAELDALNRSSSAGAP